MAENNSQRRPRPARKQVANVNYFIKQKTFRNTPLNKYELSSISPDIQNGEITDHFNYGFNSETFPVYARLCKRFAEAEELEHPHLQYDPNTNKQFRFNDDTPIDLGGFGPFLDKSLINIWETAQFQTGESLMDSFIRFNLCLSTLKGPPQNSLTAFMNLMSKEDQEFPNSISTIIDDLANKVHEKYDRTMMMLRAKQEHAKDGRHKMDSSQLSTGVEQPRQNNFYDNIFGSSQSSKKMQSKKHQVIQKQEIKETLSEDEASSQSSIKYSSISEREDDQPIVGKEITSVGQGEPKKEESQQDSQHNHRHNASSSDDNEVPSKRKFIDNKTEKDHHRHSHKKKKSHKKKIKKHKSHKKHKKHSKRSKKDKK